MFNQGKTLNPLDRNNDGRVDLKDIKGQPRPADVGVAGRTTGLNPLDRNGDGKVDLKDLTGRPGYSQGLSTQGLNGGLSSGLNNDRNMNGIPDNMERRNPLDRNGDGRVDLKDLTGRPGYGQQGLAGGLSNDRNMNGIPDNLERTSGFGTTGLNNDRNMNGIPDNLERTSGFGTTGLSNDRNMNGIPDNLERRNPLDRNGDGRVDLKDLTGRPGYGQQGLVGGLNDRNMNGIPDNLERTSTFGTSSSSYVREAPLARELIQKEVVVHEHIHPVEKEEIQPIIYREREQLDVKQITQQLHETQIQPTLIQQRELAPEYREAVVQRGAPIQENLVLPSVDRDATLRSQVVHAPIVNEVIKKTVIEEIQPVLERDIIQSTLIQETKPIYEKVIEAPIVFRETRVVQDRGISGGSLEQLAAQGFNLGSYSTGYSNDRNMNGIPDNLERRSGFSNDRNMNGIPDNLERGNFSNDRNMNGIPDNLERRNPLDRNGDGRVDLKDLTGRPGYGQQGLAGGLSNDRNMNGIPDNLERTSGFGTTGLNNDRNMNGIPDNMERRNPLDRNGDGRVDLKDLTGRPGYGQQGLAGGLSNDRNMNGIPDNLERQQGGFMGQRTANPLDRNNDGRVDLKDLTGQPGYGQQQGLLGQQGGFMGQKTLNPLDRNNDGKVDFKDLAANKAAPVGAQAPLRTL